MAQKPQMDADEQWLSVPSFPSYEASTLGKIRRAIPGPSTRVGRVLQGEIVVSGYRMVVLCEPNTKQKKAYVHRLVALTFLGEPNGLEVNHISGIKTENRISNLEYVTRSQNHLHAVELGLKKSRGELNPKAKLNEEQVREIRRLVASGMSQRVVAELFNLYPTAVSKIVNRYLWRHVS